MAGETRNTVLPRDVRTLFGFGVVRDSSDRQLLERFLTADHCGGRGGLHCPGRAPRPDGPARLPASARRFARRSRRLPGHIPGVPAPGGVDPEPRLAGQLALWGRHAGGAAGAICRGRAAVSRATRRRYRGSACHGNERTLRVPGGVARGDRAASASDTASQSCSAIWKGYPPRPRPSNSAALTGRSSLACHVAGSGCAGG